jgi:hypothetical protein
MELSQQHLQTPTQEVHMQTVGAKPEVILGKPDTIEEVAHAHHDHVELDLNMGELGDPNANTPKRVTHTEPDLMPGEDINPNMNAPAHLEGAEPEVLMDKEDDHLLKVEEDGAARKAISVEGNMGPHIKLREPGVSYLAMQENTASLTPLPLLSPPPPPYPDIASMQHSLIVNAWTLITSEPDSDNNNDNVWEAFRLDTCGVEDNDKE